MLDYKQLLSKIYEDEKVEFILETLGCHSIHSEQGGSLIVGARPDGDNTRSVQINNNSELKGCIHTASVQGDLYDIVQNILELKFASEARDYLLNICGYDENTKYEEHPLAWLKKVKKQRKKYTFNYDMDILDENILNQYIYGDIKQFSNENISPEMLINFKIGYDVVSKRITIPVRDIYGNLCGVKGRATTKEDSENQKFLYLYKCNQKRTLFNYYKVKEVTSYKEVLVFESEKSPIQMEEMGIFNTVGIGSSNISRHQLNLLEILNKDIVLCFDEGIDFKKKSDTFVKFFEGKRNVYAVIDTGIMSKKASPSDDGIEVWKELYKNKVLLCKGE